MKKAVKVKRRWQVLGAALFFIMTGCSSSPEKLLIGEWKCESDDKGSTSFNLKFETSNGSLTVLRDGKNLASFSKIDGNDIYFSFPGYDREGGIRIRDSHTIELIDPGKADYGFICKRMSKGKGEGGILPAFIYKLFK